MSPTDFENLSGITICLLQSKNLRFVANMVRSCRVFGQLPYKKSLWGRRSITFLFNSLNRGKILTK